MKRKTLEANVTETKTTTKDALQTVVDNLNQGQRKKLAKVEEVKALFEFYGVEIEEK